MKYLVCTEASEDRQMGRLWHIVDAHSAEAAASEIGDVSRASLVVALADPPTVVQPTVTWKTQEEPA